MAVSRPRFSSVESEVMEVKALFIEHDHVSPPGPVAERLHHHGFETVEKVVVSQENFTSPNVDFTFPDASEFDLIIPLGAPWGAWDDGCIGKWLLPGVDSCNRRIGKTGPRYLFRGTVDGARPRWFGRESAAV